MTIKSLCVGEYYRLNMTVALRDAQKTEQERRDDADLCGHGRLQAVDKGDGQSHKGHLERDIQGADDLPCNELQSSSISIRF